VPFDPVTADASKMRSAPELLAAMRGLAADMQRMMATGQDATFEFAEAQGAFTACAFSLGLYGWPLSPGWDQPGDSAALTRLVAECQEPAGED
jgi:hypothetical protein